MVQRLEPLNGEAQVQISVAPAALPRGPLFRVRVGPFSDVTAMDLTTERLARLGVISHIVVD